MKFVDSSVWLSYIDYTQKEAADLIESNTKLFSSILTLFEVRKILIKLKVSNNLIGAALDFIKIRSLVVNIDEEIVNMVVGLSLNKKLHTMDSLIYASALSLNLQLVTADNDFRGLENVIVIGK